MSKQKERKRELATHNSTADRVDRADNLNSVREWQTELRSAERRVTDAGGGLQTVVEEKAKIIARLLALTEKEKIQRRVALDILAQVGPMVSKRAAQIFNQEKRNGNSKAP